MQRLVNDSFTLGLLAVATMLPVGSFAAPKSGGRPNVLFIAIDDLRQSWGATVRITSYLQTSISLLRRASSLTGPTANSPSAGPRGQACCQVCTRHKLAF